MIEAPPAPTYREKVRRSVYWQAGGQLIGQVLSWAISLAVVRMLSHGDYGLMATGAMLVGLLAMVAELGIGASIIQAEEFDRDQLASTAAVIYLLNGSAFLLIMLGAPLFAAVFAEPRLIPILRALSFSFLFSSVYVVPQSLLIRDLRFREKASVELAGTVVASLTGLAIALTGGGVWSLVGSFLVLNAIKAVLFNMVVGPPVLPRWSRGGAKTHLRFGSTVMFDRIMNYLHGSVDIVIGGRFLGVNLLGLYSVALSIASIPLDKVLPAVTQVSFAAFSRIQSERERVVRNLLRGIRVVSLFAFPVFFGIAVVAQDFVPLVLGEKWNGIVPLLQLLCLVLPLKGVASLMAPALYAIGRPGVNVGNTMLTLVVMTVAFLVGVDFGVIGLAGAWVVAYPIVFCIATYRSARAIGVSIRDLIFALAVPAGAAAVMCVAVIGVRMILPDHMLLVFRLALTVSVGAAVYCALLLPYRDRALSQLGVLWQS